MKYKDYHGTIENLINVKLDEIACDEDEQTEIDEEEGGEE